MINENLQEFHLDEYIEEFTGEKTKQNNVFNISRDKYSRFYEVCKVVKEYFKQEWDKEQKQKIDNADIILERQRKAILGHTKEVSFFKTNISSYIKTNNLLETSFPEWYENLVDGIFQENWGLAGISEWTLMQNSSSAKIIGDRIYYLINGRQQLQKQTISPERLHQLKTALLLNSPRDRKDKDVHELYMEDGTRITIFNESITKKGQLAIVFRKYIVDNFKFEEQSGRGTIPYDAIPMFKAMVKVGFNVAFTGPVRAGKTTFLTTWQSYEDPTLEGIWIETDPEVPMHKISPNAPIMQLVADQEQLEGIVKSVMRSDADYIVLAEARDGIALNIGVKVCNKGTRRVKIAYHNTDSIDFCYDVADDIIKVYGGDLYSTIIKVAKSFNYIFEFTQLSDKSKKRLKAIYEIRYDTMDHKITVHRICKYCPKDDNWTFRYDIGKDKHAIGQVEDSGAFNIFKSELKKLALMYPMEGENAFTPAYEHLRRG